MSSEKYNPLNNQINMLHVLIAFLIPFVSSFFITIPFFIYFVVKYGLDDIPIRMTLVLSCLSSLTALFCLMLYTRRLPREIKYAVIGQEIASKLKWLKDLLLGSMMWIVAFPLITITSMLIKSILYHVYHGPLYEQVAVTELKEGLQSAPLMFIMVVNVVIIVPILEEFMFRGYLQSWLTTFVSQSLAIVISSFIFAFLHLSTKQGINNIEIFFALFVLSLFLGYIRIKKNSIWAAIGLHMTFNGISTVLIINS